MLDVLSLLEPVYLELYRRESILSIIEKLSQRSIIIASYLHRNCLISLSKDILLFVERYLPFHPKPLSAPLKLPYLSVKSHSPIH